MKRPLILLAEDQSEALHFFELFPEYAANVVARVQDERALLTAVTVLKPDIVIVDLDLRSLNGIETIRQVRWITQHSRVILKSVHSKPETIAEAYSAGASAYLVKGSFLSMSLAIWAMLENPQWTTEWKATPPVDTADGTTFMYRMR